MNLSNVYNTLNGAVGVWEWLTSLKPLYYIIIIGVLLVLAVGAIIFALAKKARIRHNDVNVLLMLGDNEDSVDTSIFKKHYAMVLISKTDNATVAEPKQLQPLVQLADNAEEIIQENNIIDEEVVELENNDEEIIVEDAVRDEFVEDIPEFIIDNPSEGCIIEEETDEVYSDDMAVDQSTEEIPFAESSEDAEEAILDMENVEEIFEPIVESEPVEEEIIEEVIDEVAATNEFLVEENDNADIADIEEITMEEELETEPEDEVEVFDDLCTVAPKIINTNAEHVVDVKPKEPVSLYDIDNSLNGEGDRIEVVTYVRDNGVCKGSTELVEEETTQLQIETTEETAVESEPEIFEEVMLVSGENNTANVVEEPVETQEEEVTVNEIESEELVVENTEESVIEAQSEDKVENLVVDAIEEEVAAASAEVIEETETDNSELELHEVTNKSEEELAYALVNADDALPEAIEAAENGDLIVDANGDGIAEEVLVDKNILKSRYKTVDLETRLRRTEESVKGYYSEIKNFLLSYSGVKSRVSKKFDTFTIGRFIVAKMALRGNVINLYLALASESVEDKYFAEDVGNSETYGKTPTLHKVKSKRGCKYGIELIRDIMSELQIASNDKYVPTDYVALYPPEDIEEKKNEIRHLFKDSVSVEDLGVMSDEESMEFIEIVKNKEYTINKFLPINKYVIFVDDLDKLYDSGEIVTINDLINKEALPKEENIFLEIRARGTLTRKLTVEAHSFDPNAIKMIILTDGKVIQYK